jgi:superfamily II DNA/RNA helicase
LPATFAALGVPPDLVACLARRGITEPFAVQTSAIPDGLAGRDVSACAPTGSGKTIAFGIPLVSRVERAKPKRPRALVLAPTRELAAQIAAELAPLAALRSRSIAAVYGGVGFGAQIAALRRGVDIVVACPGRLADLVNQGLIDLGDVDLVVVDEADRMADMGFLPEVRRLLDRVRDERQTLLFSATLDGDVGVLVRRYQRNPIRHEVSPPDRTGDGAQHVFWATDAHQRVQLTIDIVERHASTIVFCRTKRGADRLSRQLTQAGVSAAAIHGDRSQSQRERALDAFSSGRVRALVATDVAARGIHVDGVGCVVHFDPPGDEKDYIHRSGRTARAGSAGVVVSLVRAEHRDAVKSMQRRLGLAAGVHPADVPSLAGAAVAGAPRQQQPRAARPSRGPRPERNGRPRRRAGSSRR